MVLHPTAHCSGAAELLQPGVAGDWSVRDIIAYVTTWEQEALRHLPLILTGETPPRYSVTHGGINAFNAHMTEQKKGLSLSETLRERDEVHRRLVRFIEIVADGELSGATVDGGLGRRRHINPPPAEAPRSPSRPDARENRPVRAA